MSIIQIKNLAKSYRVYQKKEGLREAFRGLFRREYKTVEAVKNVNLTVERGEFVAFLGPNGAGKTTTLKLLSGVIYPTSGVATVMGFTPWERSLEYRRRFALVMGQKNQLWWDLPAQESFRLNQKIYRLETEQFEATLDRLTSLLDVKRLLGRPVRELSLGERMKMELIAALLHDPEVLFLDEPTIGLDVIAQHKIQQFLKQYQEERGITILLTSHYMKDVAALCKRVVVIAEGSVQYDGSLAGIVDVFSKDKIVTLELEEGQSDAGLERFGTIETRNLPKVALRCERNRVSQILTQILNEYTIADVAVEDPPLEEVIAKLYTQVSRDQNTNNEGQS
ncbi:MAG: ABC transporter ATP-binding protein [Pirellula sp.]|jgi:ABC-2 type transport system ATP-binding protein|nr:ABC transporter ATP-binding protein [Pirellula sp.]